MRIAPLLIQPMELAPDENGRDQLRSSGVPSLHTGVITELLDEDDAADLLAHWQPAWQEGNGAQMITAVRDLLTKLGLPELEPLDLSALSGRTVMDSLRPGAHNAAVLLAPSGVQRNATEALVDNLIQMSSRTGQISGTALGALLMGDDTRQDLSGNAPVVVAPGPCNESQEQVIASAMTRPLTVSTGPPGTGKSQVVTAVVTTAIAAGESVVVASTNNEAVDVVGRRCSEISPGLIMRTGNAAALEREAESLKRLLDQPIEPPARSSTTVGGELRNLHLKSVSLRTEAGQLVGEEARLLELMRERARRTHDLSLPVELLESVWAGSDDAALARWEERARKTSEAAWFFFGRWRRARALSAIVGSTRGTPQDAWPAWATKRPVPPELLLALGDAVAVERELRDLVPKHLGRDEEGLKAGRLESAARLSETAGELAGAVAAEALARGRTMMERRLQALRQRSGFQRSQRNLMTYLKAWAISTHSIRQLELVPKLFDLVVIDEASQCSIPSVLPLLFRAKRALIIGDPMQLGHIPGITAQQERQARIRSGLSAAQLEDRRLTYHVYSSYHAAEQQHGGAALLLDEHYRCHPAIADVVNGYCYAGQLKVLTDVRDQAPAVDPVEAADPAPVLGWVDVPNGESARGADGQSWRNAAEAERVRETVDELLAQLPDQAEVGVITPFRAQKDALAKLWPGDERVRVGTVHAFQGGQCDVMVLSPVATRNTPPPTTHWVASQVNLWNVAITRAKSQLITVGSLDFWQEQDGLPALLADRSALLGALTDSQQATAFGVRAPSGFREELGDRLQEYLGLRGITDLERAAGVGGHTVDLLFTVDGANTAVLVDPGPEHGQDPARHLRLMHARGDLLTGLPSGGRGAKSEPVERTVRVPAWRILGGAVMLDPLFDRSPSSAGQGGAAT